MSFYYSTYSKVIHLRSHFHTVTSPGHVNQPHVNGSIFFKDETLHKARLNVFIFNGTTNKLLINIYTNTNKKEKENNLWVLWHSFLLKYVLLIWLDSEMNPSSFGSKKLHNTWIWNFLFATCCFYRQLVFMGMYPMQNLSIYMQVKSYPLPPALSIFPLCVCWRIFHIFKTVLNQHW